MLGQKGEWVTNAPLPPCHPRFRRACVKATEHVIMVCCLFIICCMYISQWEIQSSTPSKTIKQIDYPPSVHIFQKPYKPIAFNRKQKLHDIFLHAYYLVFSFKESIKIPHTALCNGTRACRAAYKNVLHVLSSKKGWLSFIKPVVSLDVLKEFQT